MICVYLNTKHRILQLKKTQNTPRDHCANQANTNTPSFQPNATPQNTLHMYTKSELLNYTGAIYKQSEGLTSHFTPKNPT